MCVIDVFLFGPAASQKNVHKFPNIDPYILVIRKRKMASKQKLHHLCQVTGTANNVFYAEKPRSPGSFRAIITLTGTNPKLTETHTGDFRVGKKDAKESAAAVALQQSALLKVKTRKKTWGSPAQYAKDCERLFDGYVIRTGVQFLDTLGPVVAVDLEGLEKHRPVLLAQIADDLTVVLVDFSHKPSRKRILAFLRGRRAVIVCDVSVEKRYLGELEYVDIQDASEDQPRKSLKSMASEVFGARKQGKFQPSFYRYESWRLSTIDPLHKAYAAADAIYTYQLWKKEFVRE